MGWPLIDQRRCQIVALAGRGHDRDAIASMLGVSASIVMGAMADHDTSFRALKLAKRAERITEMVYRGIPLPVVAALHGLSVITIERDLLYYARLKAVRWMRDAGEGEGDIRDYISRRLVRQTYLLTRKRNLMADFAVLDIFPDIAR